MEAFRERHTARNNKKNFQIGRDKMKYQYPAVISYSSEDKVYYADFPDIPNCFTDGQTLREALDNAGDVLTLMLLHNESTGKPFPEPSGLDAVQTGKGEIAALIEADTGSYNKIAV